MACHRRQWKKSTPYSAAFLPSRKRFCTAPAPKGTYKTGSDIDLTLYGDALTTAELGAIVEELDDLLLPYQIDLSIFEQIAHAKLREHIERVGVVFYEKNKDAN